MLLTTQHFFSFSHKNAVISFFIENLPLLKSKIVNGSFGSA